MTIEFQYLQLLMISELQEVPRRFTVTSQTREGAGSPISWGDWYDSPQEAIV